MYKGLEPQSQTVITFSGSFDYDDQVQRSAIRALAIAVENQLLRRR